MDARGLETLSVYDERDRLVAAYRPPSNPAVPQYVSGPQDADNPPQGWTSYTHPEALGGSYLMAETATDPVIWTMGITSSSSGRAFALMATWAPDANNIDDARFTVEQTGFGGLWFGAVNQQKRPNDYQDADGRMWEVLTVFVSGGGATTTLAVTADPGAQADGMQLIEVDLGSLKHVYDAAGQLTSSVDLRGQTTSYQYDALGRQTIVTLPDPDGPSNPQIPPQMRYEYDANGNVLFEKVRLTATPTFLTTEHRYDRLNRRLKTFDANQASVPELQKVFTNVQYDANGNMTKLTDANSNDTAFVFDALNRVSSETNELSKTHSFEYDAASRMIKETDRRGLIIEHIFDNLGRQTSELWKSSGGALQRTLSFTFDNRGRLQSASDPAATYNHTYDNWDRPLQTTTTIAGLTPSVVSNEDWDIAGRRTELRATIGATADFKNNYTLDNLGRTTKITQQGQGGNTVASKRVNYNYTVAGDVANMARHSHLTGQALVMATVNLRDNLGRVTSFSQSNGGGVLAFYTSAFDGAGRVNASSRITNSPTSVTETASYTHDNTGQLTGVTRSINGVPTFQTYNYDATGNRTGGGYGVGASNRITTDGTYNYTHDNEGNITQRTLISNPNITIVYAYDHRNRLAAVSEFVGGHTKNILYSYDVFNRRVIKSIDPDGSGAAPYDPTYFVYDTDDIVLALQANGSVRDRYLHGPAVDEILADENHLGGVLWALKDQFYNVRDLADHQGAHYNHIDYDAFGLVTGEWKPASQGHLVHAYGFQSRERDQETGHNYHRNRYLRPHIGRWISEDPIGFAAGDVNLNRFVGNQPTIRLDPNGTDFITVQTFSVVGVGGHYSLNYWAQTDDSVVPKRRWFQFSEGHQDAVPGWCATRTERVELWRHAGYKALATQNVLTLWFTVEKVERVFDVSVSVIEFDVMNREDVMIFPVFHGSDENTKKKWDTIVANAKTYKFAEQYDDVANNRFPNWPDSRYSLFGTNSNSFVWEMLRRADLAKPPGNGYWHPGNDPPVRNRAEWIFKEPPTYDE